MLGRNPLIIDAAEFLKGMSSGSEISDGGFSDESSGLNLIAEPGVVYGPSGIVDADTDTRLTGNIIASSPDMNVYLGTNRLLVADDGSYYSYNGTKIPAVALQTDSTNTYVKGFTDIITFAGRAYVTTKEKLVEWQTPSTFNNSFASFTNTTYPHPAIVFENNAFYGDGNLLLRQTSAGGALATILTLSADQIIVALGIDPGSGKMLISTANALNISDTLPAIHKVLWYDGFSNKPLKSVIVEDMITAFHSVGGNVFAGYGTNIGYLTGSGITFLRKLANVTLDSSKLPYKHNFATMEGALYVVDGPAILAYGDVLPGRKIWRYCIKNNVNSNPYTAIFNGGNQKLGLCFAAAASPTKRFWVVDITAKSTTDNYDLYTNWYNFPRPVNIKLIHLEWLDAVTTSSWSFVYYDQDGSGSKTLSVDGGNVTSKYEFNLVGFQQKVTSFKFRATSTTVNKGLKRIIIYYDYAE